MKNFENFQLSNRGKCFLIIVVGTMLFFALAGLNKLVAQNPKDCLGYSLQFNNSGDKDKFYLAYSSLIYNSATLLDTPKSVTSILDTLYVKLVNTSKESTLNLGTSLMERLLNDTYRFSNEKEIFLYSYAKEVRSQKNWPEIDLKVSNIYGKMVGDTIYIREEITKEPLNKGWIVPIIAFCWIGVFFILLLVFQIWVIKNWEDLKFGYFFILFILLGLTSLPWMTSTSVLLVDKVGYYLYLKIWLCILAFTSLVTIIYSIALKKHKKELNELGLI